MLFSGTKTATWLLAACLLACLAGLPCHARFTVPSDGPLAFRRDRLPLDAATMAGLASDLVVLARSQAMDTALSRRDAARMLALALALQPGNDAASNLMETFKNQGFAHAVEHERRTKALTRIWQAIAWLETPEAGKDGGALAACLLDVAAAADPRHPRADARSSTGDAGAWTGWVPGLDAYEKPAVSEVETAEVEDVLPSTPEETPAVVMPLPAASVRTIIWQKSGTGQNSEWRPALATLQMTAQPPQKEDEVPTPLRIGPGGMEWKSQQFNQTVRNLLAAREERIPRGARVRITCPEFEQAVEAEKPRPVMAAAAVLASAAVTGREPDATVLGTVDASGNLTLSRDFWDQLRALEGSGNQRLVLPAAAREWLPSFLAMEKQDFFLRHEVLLAKDFADMLDLTAKEPPPAVATARAKFADISTRGAGQDVRSYVANRYVRQRLEELAREAPWHASAVLLFTQASGNRPRTVARPVLAAELHQALLPLSWLPQTNGRELNPRELKSIGTSYSACRQRLDPLEKLAAREDADILERARAVASALRTLDRSARGRDAIIDFPRGEFNRLYREVMKELEILANPGLQQ